MANPMVPARIRRLVNVESGLNDGIATPFVSVALAGAAVGGEVAGHGPAKAVAELAVGVLVGVAVGGAGGLGRGSCGKARAASRPVRAACWDTFLDLSQDLRRGTATQYPRGADR